MRHAPWLLLTSAAVAITVLAQQRMPRRGAPAAAELGVAAAAAAPPPGPFEEEERGDGGERRDRAIGGKGQRASESSPLEFASFEPPVSTAPPPAALGGGAGCTVGGHPLPSVVHQIWLGGWKPMYAKLLSVLSVHFLLRPARHVLLYDVLPTDRRGEPWPEWRCACLVAECRKATVPTTIGGHRFDDDARIERAYRKDRYASDTTGRCANSQLDLLRLETLHRHGGIVLDLDVFVLRSLDSWRRCAADAVVGWGGQLHRHSGQVSSGVLMGRPRAPFFVQWRRRLRRLYRPGSTDFGRDCNLSTALAAARPHHVHLAPELGPLPRYASRAVYDAHLRQAPLAHLSAFRHAWRLHDTMVHRHLETITAIVLGAANRSLAQLPAAAATGPAAEGVAGDRRRKHDGSSAPASSVLRECMRTIAEACWAKPGKRCGIYGA